MTHRIRLTIPILFAALLVASTALATSALAAPKAEPWPRWEAHDPASTQRVDHGAWGGFLRRYLRTGLPDGINRVAYGEVTASDRKVLEDYLVSMKNLPVSRLNRAEQKAYWINLYNALTVRVILERYPVESIRDIDISPGWFSSGPWDADLLAVEGEALTLNDIEHRILRPGWRDPRVHYAVNCASLGCPNLQPEPYEAARLDTQLDAAARDYVNHPRGARFEDGDLVVSSIYAWFREDFGGTEAGVLQHLALYAAPELAARLRDYRGGLDDDYDWTLNGVREG